jgi:hypothetical protein
MTYEKDPRVDVYIDGLPDWPQTICQEVRELVHAADQGVIETVKRPLHPHGTAVDTGRAMSQENSRAVAAFVSATHPRRRRTAARNG